MLFPSLRYELIYLRSCIQNHDNVRVSSALVGSQSLFNIRSRNYIKTVQAFSLEPGNYRIFPNVYGRNTLTLLHDIFRK